MSRFLNTLLGSSFSAAPSEGDGLVAQAPAVSVGEIARRFWPYTRSQRRWLPLLIGLVVVSPLFEAGEIWVFKLLVDDVLVPADFAAFVPIALMFIGLTVASGLFSIAQSLLSTRVSQQFLLSLRTSFFRHLQGMSLDFFERRQLGDVLSRLTGDIAAIESFLLGGLMSGVTYVLRLGVFTGALLVLNWRLALMSFAVLPLFWLLSRRFSRLLKIASREKRRRSGSITAVAEQSLGNAMLVQACNRQDWEVDRFHREGHRKYLAEMASTRLRAVFRPLIDLVELGGAFIVLGMGIWELSAGHLTLGGLLVFLTLLSRMYSPVRGMSSLVNSVYSASASAERIIEFIDQRPAVADTPGAVVLGPAAGHVELDCVTFRYPGTDREALRNVSLRVVPGQTLALVGPSGAGKSTVAKLLLRFYDPDAGRIRLDGHDLRQLRLDSLRENVAVVLQETLVFDGTIRDNIAYGRLDADQTEIVAAARAADAHAFITALPEGYDTLVGQRGRRLSGGQRQRLAIARAMLRDAPVLLLDEPTTGLDAASGQRVLAPLRRLMSGRTTIVISHDLLTVRDADVIAVLDQGQLVDSGIHDELLARNGTYSRLYRLHVRQPTASRPTSHGSEGSSGPVIANSRGAWA
ncbi:ABC transporter ATP-binding protein [Pseudonocardia lutea]|uniref:ABC transporter ATP-binding protein n=1 Tax=Pseudonocardia lutea TaxID=2172015 RepID=A0ABW1IIG9_9PSEU